MTEKTLYERLGGYDGVSGFVDDLLPRLESDSQLGRFWQNRVLIWLKQSDPILFQADLTLPVQQP
jgi:hypothetical protein